MPDASKTILAPRLDGSFRWTEGERAVDVVRTPEGFRIEADAGTNWTIEDRRGDDDGFVLWEGPVEARREIGRTSRVGSSAAGSTVLLEDGRLFLIVIRALVPARVELRGDEVPGAYLAATHDGRDWRIETTPAGELLSAPPALRWLFGAEIARLHTASGAMHG